MKVTDYHTTITVNAPIDKVFKGINNVSKWWTDDLKGSSKKLKDEFTVKFDDIHVSSQKVIEMIPGKKVVWLVTDSRLNFIKEKDEWTNTKISFELSGHNDQTRINFTHHGLNAGVECYEMCVKGWDYYIKGSLYKFLTEGKGTPGL
jgi:hypothetical protein